MIFFVALKPIAPIYTKRTWKWGRNTVNTVFGKVK